MKKVLALTVCAAGALHAAANMSIGVYRTTPGKSVTVPVYLSVYAAPNSNEGGMCGFQFSITYDPQVVICTSAVTGSLVSTFSVITDAKTPGRISCAGFDTNLTEIKNKGGQLLNLTFEPLAVGSSPLTLSDVKLSDANGNTVPVQISSGYITVAEQTSPSAQPGNVPPRQGGESTRGETAVRPGSGTPGSAPGPAVSVSPPTGRIPPPVYLPVASPSAPSGGSAPAAAGTATTPATPGSPAAPSPAGSSNSVVLLVRSPYGSPKPPQGVTTYTKGEIVECRVDDTVILSETEKAVCVGYEGYGSVPSGTGSKVSVSLAGNSRILWKWQVVPRQKDFSVSAGPARPRLPEQKMTVIPVTVHFLDGYDEPVTVFLDALPEGCSAVLAKTTHTPQRPHSALVMSSPASPGVYTVGIRAQSGQREKQCSATVICSGSLAIESRTNAKGEIEATVRYLPSSEGVASFDLRVACPDGVKFIRAVSAGAKVKASADSAGRMVSVSGTVLAGSGDAPLFTLVFRKTAQSQHELTFSSVTGTVRKTDGSEEAAVLGKDRPAGNAPTAVAASAR